MLRPPSPPSSSGASAQDAIDAGDVSAPKEPRTKSGEQAAITGPVTGPLEPPRDENPTLLKLDSSVQRVRASMIDLLPKLVIEVKREGPHGERTLIFHGEVCRIGTHSSNDLVLRDPAVSRFHCKLTRDG